MQIKKQLVPKNKWNIKCPNTMKQQYITVHNTANARSAANEISYMLRNNHATSSHYTVDDQEVIQGIRRQPERIALWRWYRKREHDEYWRGDLLL